MSNPQDLSGKIAVVTSAARGLGAAIADTLADRGAHVIVNDRTLEPAAEVAKAIEEEVAMQAPSLSMWLTGSKSRKPSANSWRTMAVSIS